MILNTEQQQRYLRNILVKEIGEDGQKKLLKSNILVIGAGGLGSAVLLYLAAAGIGNITIIDNDIVEVSNLQRQIIHNTKNLYQNKTDSAKEKINLLNQDTRIKTLNSRIDKKSLDKIINDYDLVIDATDNFYSRFEISKSCHNAKKTLIFGAVKGFMGQLSVFKSHLDNQPCYACFNPNIIDKSFDIDLKEKGVLGSVAGSIGCMQATQAIKEILQIGESMSSTILSINFLSSDYRKLKLDKNPTCKICSSK